MDGLFIDAKIEKTGKCSRSDESCLLIPVLALVVKIRVCKRVLLYVATHVNLRYDVITVLPAYHCRAGIFKMSN